MLRAECAVAEAALGASAMEDAVCPKCGEAAVEVEEVEGISACQACGWVLAEERLVHAETFDPAGNAFGTFVGGQDTGEVPGTVFARLQANLELSAACGGHVARACSGPPSPAPSCLPGILRRRKSGGFCAAIQGSLQAGEVQRRRGEHTLLRASAVAGATLG